MTKKGIQRLGLLASGIVVLTLALAVGFVLNKRNIAMLAQESLEAGMATYDEGNGDYEAALANLEEAVKYIKDNPELFKAYSVCRAEVSLPNDGHLAAAIQAAKAAIEHAPDDLSAKLILRDHYLSIGYFVELIDLLDGLIDDYPDRYDFINLKTRVLYDSRRLVEAYENAKLATQRFPDKIEAHITWSDLAKISGRVDDAEILERARALEPRFADNPEYAAWLAKWEWIGGDRGAWNTLIRRAAALPPTSADQIFSLVNRLRAAHQIADEAGIETPPGALTLDELADEVFEKGMASERFRAGLAAKETERLYWAGRIAEAQEFAPVILATPLEAEEETTDQRKIRRETAGAAAFYGALVMIGEDEETGHPLKSDELTPFLDRIGAIGPKKTTERRRNLLEGADKLRQGETTPAFVALAKINPENLVDDRFRNYLLGVAAKRIGDYRSAEFYFLALEAEASQGNADIAWQKLAEIYSLTGRFVEAERALGLVSTTASRNRLSRYDDALVALQNSDDAAETTIVAAGILRNLREDSEGNESNPSLDARLARAMILGGEFEAGMDLARSLADADPPPDPKAAAGLVRTVSAYDSELADALNLAFVGSTGTIELIGLQAERLARRGDLEAGVAVLKKEIAAREPQAALPYRRALVRVVDAFDAPTAAAEAGSLSEDYPESLAAQVSALSTKAIWKDLDIVKQALTRLREIDEAVEGNTLVWQVFFARMVLADDPTAAQITEAQEQLSVVLESVPDDFDALVLRARAYEASADLERATNPDADVSLSINQAALNYSKALRDSRFSLESQAAVEGDRITAFPPLIEMLIREDRVSEANNAMDYFLRVPSFKMPPGLIGQRLELLTQLGRWADAAEDQQRLAGSSPESLISLAAMLVNAGEAGAAQEQIEAVLTQEDISPVMIEQCADLLIDLGYRDRALEVFEMLPETHEGMPRGAVIARALARTGAPREALAFQLQAARVSGTPDAWLEAIRLAASTGDESLQQSTLDEAKAMLPNAPEIARFAESGSLSRLSLALASSIAPGESDESDALREIALSHGRGEIDDNALFAKLTELNQQSPELFEAWRLRIEGLVLRSDSDAALEVAIDAAERVPESQKARRLVIQMLRNLNRNQDALPYAEQLVRLSAPDNFEAQVTLAMIHADLGDFRRTLEILAGFRTRLVNESATQPSPGLVALATAYAGTGNPSDAESLIRKGLTTDDRAWQQAVLFAARALPKDLFERKRVWISRVTDPGFAKERAERFVEIARYSGSEEDARAALAIVNEQPDRAEGAWLWIEARAAALAGETDRSVALHRRVIEMQPGAAILYASLANTLATNPATAQDALEVARAGTAALAPGEGPSDTTNALAIAKARALITLGKASEAQTTIEPRLAASLPDPAALVLMARTSQLLGDLNRAETALIRAETAGALTAQSRSEREAVQRALNAETSP